MIGSVPPVPLWQVQAARYDAKSGSALNGMARLGQLLGRSEEPNSATSFTLKDETLLFPQRLYNTFELPTKLMKLRTTLPTLLRKPELYMHSPRVARCVCLPRPS